MGAKKEKDLDATLRFVEDLKHQWMMTVDSLIDPLMIVDEDFRISKSNQALLRVAGKKDFTQVIGRRCYEVFAGRGQPCPDCRMPAAAKSLHHQEFKLSQVAGDRVFEVRSQPIVGNDGALNGIVQTYRDVTDKERMHRQLLQAEKMAGIGLLAGGVAHEINNPLAGILVFSQMLLKDLPEGSSHRDDVKEIEAAAKRCKEIVDNLLAFARQAPGPDERSRQGKRMERLVVQDCVRDALKFARMGFKAMRGIDVADELGNASLHVLGDRNSLIHVFLNLIQNAFQAMPEGGQLYLSCRGNDDGGRPLITVTVEDNGVGIAKGDLEKIFNPFFTTKEPGEGTGLGLAICYGIVQELGGSIAVESELGAGTRFEVTLPLSRDKAP